MYIDCWKFVEPKQFGTNFLPPLAGQISSLPWLVQGSIKTRCSPQNIRLGGTLELFQCVSSATLLPTLFLARLLRVHDTDPFHHCVWHGSLTYCLWYVFFQCYFYNGLFYFSASRKISLLWIMLSQISYQWESIWQKYRFDCFDKNILYMTGQKHRRMKRYIQTDTDRRTDTNRQTNTGRYE